MKEALLVFVLIQLAFTSRVAIKVVEQPVSYGFNNDLIYANQGEGLSLLVSPANFSGPEPLRNLWGKCYNYTDDSYVYTFCPFSNVTQYEMSNRWNAYQGVLGVWQEWKIVNNTFTAMMMLHGDKCGDIFRSVEVILECNETEGLKEVSEPSKCTYLFVFVTPLVCHRDSLLVYPRLSELLQQRWDQLETELSHQFITILGYNEQLKKIFIEAGIQQPKDKAIGRKTENLNDQVTNSPLSSLGRCLKEVDELKTEIESLKILLELRAVSAAP